MIQIIWFLIRHLPQILALLKTILGVIKDLQTKRQVKEDLVAITEAFKAKDAEALRALFNR